MSKKTIDRPSDVEAGSELNREQQEILKKFQGLTGISDEQIQALLKEKPGKSITSRYDIEAGTELSGAEDQLTKQLKGLKKLSDEALELISNQIKRIQNQRSINGTTVEHNQPLDEEAVREFVKKHEHLLKKKKKKIQ